MNERLKAVRLHENVNLSQTEFGEKIGIKSRAHISSLENGTKKLTDRVITDICRVFNVNEVWLRTGVGEMFNVDQDHELAYMMAALFSEGNEFKMKFITQMLKLDDDIWAEIKSFINDLVEKQDVNESQ